MGNEISYCLCLPLDNDSDFPKHTNRFDGEFVDLNNQAHSYINPQTSLSVLTENAADWTYIDVSRNTSISSLSDTINTYSTSPKLTSLLQQVFETARCGTADDFIHALEALGNVNRFKYIRTKDSETLLHLATGSANIDVVIFLLYGTSSNTDKPVEDAGSLLSAIDNLGRTPLYLAVQNESASIVDVIKRATKQLESQLMERSCLDVRSPIGKQEINNLIDEDTIDEAATPRSRESNYGQDVNDNGSYYSISSKTDTVTNVDIDDILGSTVDDKEAANTKAAKARLSKGFRRMTKKAFSLIGLGNTSKKHKNI